MSIKILEQLWHRVEAEILELFEEVVAGQNVGLTASNGIIQYKQIKSTNQMKRLLERNRVQF